MTKTRRLIHRILDSPALSTGLLVTMYLATAATGVFGLLWPHSLATNLALFAWPAAGGSWLAIAWDDWRLEINTATDPRDIAGVY